MSAPMLVRRTGLVLFACLSPMGASGCGTGGLQSVQVCGDVSVPDDVDALRVVLRDDRYAEKSSGVIDLSDGSITLPLQVSVKAYNGQGYLSVQGLKSGLEVIRFDRHYPNLDQVHTVDAALTRACLGVLMCSLGQTCVDGACVIAPDDRSAVSCSSAGPVDTDAGMSGAGGDAG